MTPYRISSFWTGVRMLYENEEKTQHDTERRIYYSDDTLRFSSPRVQILHIRFGWRLTFPLLWRLTLPSLWRLFSNCHSERGQACLVGKTENGTMNRSEESITLMTSYRLPHYGSRSFTFVQDDVLWSSSSRQRAFVIAPGDTWPSAVRRSCWRTQCDWGYSLVVMI